MAKRTFDDFDGFADDYRQLHSENVKLSGADSFYFTEHKVGLLAEAEHDLQRACMLDVGCGDGETENFIQKRLPLWKVEAIDVSEKSIAKARLKKLPNTNFSTYGGSDIPFPGNHFDIVFIAAVLHHIDFKFHEPLMHEINRVLKPGGRLYIFEHNPINPVTRYLVNTCVFDKNAKLLPHNYSRKLLERAHFKNIKNKFILFFPRKGILAKLVKLEDMLGWLPMGGQYMYRATK